MYNCLKVNAKKFHLFLNLFVKKAMSIEDFTVKSSNTEVLLEITIDINLSLSDQLIILNYMSYHVFPNI